MQRKKAKGKILRTMKKEDGGIVRSIRYSSPVYQAIQKNADLYAGGNVAAWTRHAAQNHRPTKKELEDL